ncbi:S8 family serine peptidase [Nonomuraea endophytica]|uniref:Subtilisin family serine protease n=1 Tax=Nonomuraea endophytica TaxID=714136 RepID=A0A7W8EFE0_9ACTN|nr:S8 family serine peptidase [Nonomuraea endophytica]MBB5076377.1 subtilisin family serine protease [Nonomuraea endophytica]
MDPALSKLVSGGAADDEVRVLIRLRDPARTPDLARIVSRFGDVVTARVPRGSITRLWADDTTWSVKAPHAYAPEVESLTEEGPGAATTTVPTAYTGHGVVLGVADWGCDFAHPDLRNADGTTRLLALWDQRPAAPGGAQPYGYGRIHDADRINAALARPDPYRALGYHPADFDYGAGAHGSHTISLAAGNGRGGGPRGVAPSAALVFVNLRKGETRPLGDSVELLESIDFIHRIAGRPCVISLSLGRHAGEHTGCTLVERAMDHLLAVTPGLAIVQSCGNYYQRRAHASWLLRRGETRSFAVRADSADRTTNEVDIWYEGRDTLTVEVTAPDGSQRCVVRQGEQATLTAEDRQIARVYHRACDPNNGDHQCAVFLEPHAGEGDWTIALHAEDVVDGRVHAWIERDGGCRSCQSHFDREDSDPRTTTGSIANGFRTIVVGAYDALQSDRPRAPFSSVGPTRDHRDKPDLVAPGVQVLGARSQPRDGDRNSLYVGMSGTSMAAPQVAGAVALLFEAAGRLLPIDETRRLLLAGCDPPSKDTQGLGSGYLNVEQSLAHLFAQEPTVNPIPSGLGAADLFDAYAVRRSGPGNFDVIGAPREPLQVPLRAGDLVITSPRGIPYASVSVLAGPDVLTHPQAGRGRPPGRYVAVLDGPARLVADLGGTLLPYTLILRSREDAESEPGLWVPRAERVPHAKSAGLSHVRTAPWRLVMHTIEAEPSVDGFRAMVARHPSPAHLWAMPSADLLLQVIPLDRAAYALKHPSGTVETNRSRAVQVEIWGNAANMANAPRETLDWLAERVLRPVAELVPLNLLNVKATGGRECYGARAACRMSDAEWAAFDGVCGHQHVPNNSHWDPGRLDLGYLARRAGSPAAEAETVDDAERTTASAAARLEWLDLSTTTGGDGAAHLYYLASGPPGGGGSTFRLRVTNTNTVSNFRNPRLKVRLLADDPSGKPVVIPLGGQGDKPWKIIRSEEVPDESSRVIELELDRATRWKAYDPDSPRRWIEVEYHWYEGGLGGYVAHYTATRLSFFLVAPFELLAGRKRFVEDRPLDDPAQYRGYWRLLWANADPRPATYTLSIEASASLARSGEISVTTATTLTRAKEESHTITDTAELSAGFSVQSMLTLGQKFGTSVSSGVRWNETLAKALTTVASRSRTFTQGHTERFQTSGTIPAAPPGREQVLYAYPILGLYEVPVVIYGGANGLGQATTRKTDVVPVVWLRGWGAKVELL